MRGWPGIAVPGGLVLAGLSGCTVARMRVWRDSLTLWRDTATRAPSYTAFQNLGAAHADRGEWVPAEEAFRRSMAAAPGEGPPYDSLGVIYAQLEQRALRELLPTLERNAPLSTIDLELLEALTEGVAAPPPVLSALLLAYERAGLYDRGVAWLRERLRATPDDPSLWFTLARYQALAGRADDAFAALEQALERGGDTVRAWASRNEAFRALRDDARWQGIEGAQE